MELSKRINLEGTINTRDLGGYEGFEGKHIVFNRLIRTDSLSQLTKNDITFLVDNYNPKWDIDLRSEDEIKRDTDVVIPGCEFIRLSLHNNSQKQMVDHHTQYHLSDGRLDGLIDFIYFMSDDGDVDKAMQKSNHAYFTHKEAIESQKKFLELCRDNKEGSLLFHCKDGKDRTGFMAALILEVLGVKREDIMKDYLMTNIYTKAKADERREFLEENNFSNKNLLEGLVAITGVRECWLKSALDTIDEVYGGIIGYCKQILSTTEEDIKIIRENYLR